MLIGPVSGIVKGSPLQSVPKIVAVCPLGNITVYSVHIGASVGVGVGVGVGVCVNSKYSSNVAVNSQSNKVGVGVGVGD